MDKWVSSSLAASMEMASVPAVLRESLWEEGGMPVTVSSLVLSWLMDHDGVMRRSDDANSEMMRRGTSAMVTDGAGAGAYWELELALVMVTL